MVNAYLSFGVFAGACAALYKREDLFEALSSFAAKPMNLQGQPSVGGFRPMLEADGLHPFEFFGLSDGEGKTQQSRKSNQ